MGVRLISAAVGIVIAVIILILHNTILLKLAIAAVTLLMLFELFRAGRCLRLRLTCIPAFIYGAVSPFLAYGSASKYRFAVNLILILCIFITYIAQHKTLKYYRLLFILSCTILVSKAMSCLIILNGMDKTHGLMYLIMGLSLIQARILQELFSESISFARRSVPKRLWRALSAELLLQVCCLCLSTLDIQRYFLSLRTVLSALIILKSAYLEWLLRLSEL